MSGLPHLGLSDMGSSRLSIYLWNVTDADVEQLADDVAGLLVREGYAGDECRAIVAAEGWDCPDSPEAIVKDVGGSASFIVIPNAEAA